MNQHFTIEDKYKQVQSLGALRTSSKALTEQSARAFFVGNGIPYYA